MIGYRTDGAADDDPRRGATKADDRPVADAAERPGGGRVLRELLFSRADLLRSSSCQRVSATKLDPERTGHRGSRRRAERAIGSVAALVPLLVGRGGRAPDAIPRRGSAGSRKALMRLSGDGPGLAPHLRTETTGQRGDHEPPWKWYQLADEDENRGSGRFRFPGGG